MILENIANLTSLWQTVGERVHAYYPGAEFDYCAIADSDWPNRLWFHQDLTVEELKAAKEQLLAAPTKLIVPHWDIYQSQSHSLLEAAGFKKLSEQVGMGLRLTGPFGDTEPLQFKTVSTQAMAVLWADLFTQAFAYRINHQLLLPADERTYFLVVFQQNSPIGTCLLHYSENKIIGIHAMGVIPTMRGQGFAERIMKQLLNQAIQDGFDYATLQASAMGKGLYLKLGFQEQFIMRNYALPQLR